ncbi:MAG: peroxiredoxin family protein [Parvularculaceae bacterium]|nr:peroxiredoxin family protein [Parvularculaceae bacterium]
MFRQTVLAAALMVLGAIAPAAAELGPKVGSAVPHDLAATDATGAKRAFDNLVGPKGMALFFVRSVDWCPYCKAQTLNVDASRAEFEKRGLSVVFVSYDAVDKQKKFAVEKDVGVTLLSDPKSEIIDAFGLRNEKHVSGRFAGIPHPAAFIVKPDRTIAAKLYETDYETNDKSYVNRPEVGAILAAADSALQ